MSSWTKIKEFFVHNKRPGSTGRMAAVHKAAMFFGEITPYLNDIDEATAEFGDDTEVKAALLNTGTLEEIGMI